MQEYNDQQIVRLPMLPMRNIVVFPHMTTPFFIGRKQSIEALEKALAGNRQIFVVAQKDPLVEEPNEEDLYEVGTVGHILQVMRLPNGTIKALFEATDRAVRKSVYLEGAAYEVELEIKKSLEDQDTDTVALLRSVRDEFKTFVKKGSKTSESNDRILNSEASAGELSDLVAPLLTLEIAKQQELLSELNAYQRLELVYTRMLEEEEHKKLEQKLKERVQGQIGRTQKEYYLNEQMKAIQKELGAEDTKEEFDELEEKIEAVGLSEGAKDTALKELKKLKMMPPMSSEANIVRNYLDWMVTVPWKATTTDLIDLDHTQKILDEDHYALEKVKERIIEYIAVAKMVGSLRGPIICLVGPPGVGKTSLARSIARSIGRTFVRMSLGGVRDEAEIRGHRRTYIGALPGKILQSMKKAKTNNPVLLLDEIDKMGQSHLGDPASALLEILDPEQNKEFMDHYLEVEYDLSQVMFICTANSKQDIPLPLMDRLEVIELSGYTELEKEKIAFNYLIPRQKSENGLKPEQLEFTDLGLSSVIRHYTKEAGVRSLERRIAKLCRKAVTDLVKQGDAAMRIVLDEPQVRKYLGVAPFQRESIDRENEVGIVNGLAWTSAGGEVLTIEVNTMKGKGNITLTGKLGDVMKESAQAAHSWVRANANRWGIYSSVFRELDIHVHVPEGATPKDGPSAGVAITSALVSALTGIPIRKDIALTGEVTLRGKILAIGGLKEKLLAAKRNEIYEVLIPFENEKDLEEIEPEIQKGLTIRPLKYVGDVLERILETKPTAVRDEDQEKLAVPQVAGFSSESHHIKPN